MYDLLDTRYQYFIECSIIQEHYVVPNNLKSIIETHAGQEIHDSFKKDNNEKHQLYLHKGGQRSQVDANSNE